MPIGCFREKIKGIAHLNRLDGSDRQDIIRRAVLGEPVYLILEPDNPVDPNAVMIVRASGEALGYLSARFVETLAPVLREGAVFRCRLADFIVEPESVKGGIVEGILLSEDDPTKERVRVEAEAAMNILLAQVPDSYKFPASPSSPIV